MAKFIICYDTWYGHTKKIAEFIETVLEDHGHIPLLHNIRNGDAPPLSLVDSIIVLGPIQRGRHSPYLDGFVREHRAALSECLSLFLSISLAAAGNERQREDARGIMDNFLTETSWRPNQREIVAGDLPYLRYGLFTRWMMRWIVGREGGDTDTSRNYDYTDWGELNRIVGELTGRIPEDTSAHPVSAPR